MKATDILKQEHENIKLMLRIIEISTARIEIGGQVPVEDIEQMVEFLKVFVEGCHFKKEEDILASSLESADLPRETGPIGVMIAEHNTSKVNSDALGQAVAEYKKNDATVIPKIVESSSNYVELMTRHINRENNMLFPLADARLSDDEQGMLALKFDAVEQEEMGSEKCVQFIESLVRFRDSYLKQW